MTIKKQIQNAALDMMEKIKLDRWHRYIDTDGRFLAGGSTIAGVVPKKEVGFLAPWGGKEAVKALGFYDILEGEDHIEDIEFAQEQLDKIKKGDVQDFLKILKEAKGGSKRKSEEAMDVGKEGHKWLENYVKAKIRGTELPEIKYWNGHPWIKKSIEDFIEWEKENIVEWYLSEALVCRLDNPLASKWDTPKELKGYAGTLDALALTEDGLAIIDFKFSARISVEYFLQTAGYNRTFAPYDIEIPHRVIIRLPKEEFAKEYNEKTYTYKKVKDNLQVVWGDPKLLDWDFETFLHQREILRWFNYSNK